MIKTANSLVPYEVTIPGQGQDAAPGVAAVDTPTQSQSPDTVEAAADEAQEPPVSLDDIKAEFGVLYLPAYVPQAYTFHHAAIVEWPDLPKLGKKALLRYVDNGHQGMLVILQHAEGYIPTGIRGFVKPTPAPIDLAEPRPRRLTVEGLVIYLSSPIRNHVSFKFEKDGRWIQLNHAPSPYPQDPQLDLAELVKVANSLEPYEGRRSGRE